MNILIVANHYAVCSARYAADAFTRLGHTVKHVGRPMGRDIWGMQVPEAYVWTPDFQISYEDGLKMHEFQHDVVIVMDSDANILDWLEALPLISDAPIIVWGVDNHVRDYRRPYFDHYFLAHRSVSVMDWTHPFDARLEGNKLVSLESNANADMTWLPCAYDPVAFPPSPIAWSDRKYDVCMVGVMYPKRWELVNAMRAVGLKVFAGTGLVYDAYRDAYHNSRVALVSSFNGDLPIRLFEGAGMGCAVVCDEISDLPLLSGDIDWAHNTDFPIWQYHDVDEAVKIAQVLQVAPIWGERGAAWAATHTWDARCQVVLSWLEARS